MTPPKVRVLAAIIAAALPVAGHGGSSRDLPAETALNPPLGTIHDSWETHGLTAQDARRHVCPSTMQRPSDRLIPRPVRIGMTVIGSVCRRDHFPAFAITPRVGVLFTCAANGLESHIADKVRPAPASSGNRSRCRPPSTGRFAHA